MLVQDEVPVVGSLGDSKPWLLLFLKLSLLSKTRACCRKHSCCCSLEIFWGRKEVLPHGWVWQVLPGIRDVGSCWSWVAWWHLPRDQHHSVTSVAAWSLSFSHFYWIDKRSNELPALEDLGVCCVYFLVMFFCPIWAGSNSKNSYFPTDWESSFFGVLQLFSSLSPTLLRILEQNCCLHPKVKILKHRCVTGFCTFPFLPILK